MKELIPALILFFISPFAVAQNVGIGTNTPSFKLDVRNGSINTDSVYRIGSITVLSTPGTLNLFVGRNAGTVNTGIFNTFCGINAGSNNTSGIDNSFFGAGAGSANTTGNNNSFFGTFSGDNNTIGIHNSFFGRGSGTNTNSGFQNSFFGSGAGGQNSSGSNNSYFGFGAGAQSSFGYSNVAVGMNALHFNEGSNQVAVGDSALMQNAGFRNTAVGSKALYENQTGSQNVAVGYGALINNASSASDNTALGYHAMFDNVTGDANTAIGRSAMSGHTIFGFDGDENTAIGAFTNFTSDIIINSTAIGARTLVGSSNQIRLGNTFVNSIGGPVGWTSFSDGRFKQDVQNDVPGLDFIMQLQPVTYTLRVEDIESFRKKMGEQPVPSWYGKAQQEMSSIRFTGFIAQDVETTARKLNYNFSGVDAPKNSNDTYGLRYAEFVVPIIKALQEQQALLLEQQKTIDELKEIVTELRKQIDQ